MAISKQPVVRDRCKVCGSVNHSSLTCQNIDNDQLSMLMKEELERNKKRKQRHLAGCPAGILDGERTKCICEEIRRNEAEVLKQHLVKNQDGVTWMVSIIHPDYKDGNTFYSERAGRTAKEAALSYINDREDNLGAEKARLDPEMTLIVVIDSREESMVLRKKIWKVNIFTPKAADLGKWDLVEFS